MTFLSGMTTAYLHTYYMKKIYIIVLLIQAFYYLQLKVINFYKREAEEDHKGSVMHLLTKELRFYIKEEYGDLRI